MKFSRQTVLALSLTFLCFGAVLTKRKDHERPLVKALEGDSITLSCDRGSVTQETLYAVKWYKDEKEFYRNYPKAENPVKVYPIEGFTLETPLASPWQVVLQNVNSSASGKYTCMVVDYPRYRTIYRSTQVDITSKNATLQSQADASGRSCCSILASGINYFAVSFVLIALLELAFDIK